MRYYTTRLGHISTLLLTLGFSVLNLVKELQHLPSHENHDVLIPAEHVGSLAHFAEESAKRLEEKINFKATVRSFFKHLSLRALWPHRWLGVAARSPRTRDQQLLHLVSASLLPQLEPPLSRSLLPVNPNS